MSGQRSSPEYWPYLQHPEVVIVISVALMALSAYELRVVVQAPFASTVTFFWTGRAVPPMDYLFSLGPLVVLAFWIVWDKHARANTMVLYLVAWVGLPIVLYPRNK